MDSLPLHLSILPDLSVKFITYLISYHLVSIGLYACVRCVELYARTLVALLLRYVRCVTLETGL